MRCWIADLLDAGWLVVEWAQNVSTFATLRKAIRKKSIYKSNSNEGAMYFEGVGGSFWGEGKSPTSKGFDTYPFSPSPVTYFVLDLSQPPPQPKKPINLPREKPAPQKKVI